MTHQGELGEEELRVYAEELLSPSVPGHPAALEDKIVPNVDSDSSAEEAHTSPDQIPAKGVWVVTSGRNTSTLHIVGKCFRIPMKHYTMWKVVADPVQQAAFRRPCRSCFPQGYPIVTKPAKPLQDEPLCEGMPRSIADEEASDSADSQSD